MGEQNRSPIKELEAIAAEYDWAFDEPDSLRLIAELREAAVLGDADWTKVLESLRYSMESLGRPSTAEPGVVLCLDADPRNADWIRIVRARRQAGVQLPSWAALWIWWLGYDRPEETFWTQVGQVAERLGCPPIEDQRNA